MQDDGRARGLCHDSGYNTVARCFGGLSVFATSVVYTLVIGGVSGGETDTAGLYSGRAYPTRKRILRYGNHVKGWKSLLPPWVKTELVREATVRATLRLQSEYFHTVHMV